MTTPVGGFAPGAQSVPGCAPNGEATLLDAGVCSKLVRTIPSFSTFFRNVRHSIVGLRQSSSSSTDAVKILLQTQANVNDQTNQLNYWMRQVSPQLDKLSNELVHSNDVFAALPPTSSGTAFNAPGIPDSITLVPGPALDNLLLYFTRPSFQGASPVVGYELVSFTSNADALAFSNPSPTTTLTEADLITTVSSAPWNTPNADEHYSIYGDELRVVNTGLVTGGAGHGLSVRLRAYNTSGDQNAPLFGPWSTPTLLACAASDAEDLKPSVEQVTTGVSFSLVEWRAPEVLQPDQSWASVGGLHSFLVAGSANSSGTVVLGGASTIAQIPLTAADTTVTVAACSTADGTAPVGVSGAELVQIPTAVPYPTINVQLVTSDPTGVYALVKCVVEDYYSSTAIRYKVTATDVSSGGANTVTAAGDSPVPGTSAAHNSSILKVVRVPATGSLQSSGTEFIFTATAEHAAGPPYISVASPAAGPFRIP
jgi:hypothetical protein